MSKKLSEFDRYDRMKKLEREAEVEKKRTLSGIKPKNKRPRLEVGAGTGKSRLGNHVNDLYDDLYDEYY